MSWYHQLVSWVKLYSHRPCHVCSTHFCGTLWWGWSFQAFVQFIQQFENFFCVSIWFHGGRNVGGSLLKKSQWALRQLCWTLMLDIDVLQDLLPVVDFGQVLLDKQFFPLKLISQLWYVLFQSTKVMAIQHNSAISITRACIAIQPFLLLLSSVRSHILEIYFTSLAFATIAHTSLLDLITKFTAVSQEVWAGPG